MEFIVQIGVKKKKKQPVWKVRKKKKECGQGTKCLFVHLQCYQIGNLRDPTQIPKM